MSTYEYIDRIGDKLRINSNGYGGATAIAEGTRGIPLKTVLIEREDVPTVALELLKAAGHTDLAGYVISAIAARETAEKAEAEAAEKKLWERRDALARDLSGDDVLRYEHIRSSLRKAIDRIIELEDGASRD